MSRRNTRTETRKCAAVELQSGTDTLQSLKSVVPTTKGRTMKTIDGGSRLVPLLLFLLPTFLFATDKPYDLEEWSAAELTTEMFGGMDCYGR